MNWCWRVGGVLFVATVLVSCAKSDDPGDVDTTADDETGGGSKVGARDYQGADAATQAGRGTELRGSGGPFDAASSVLVVNEDGAVGGSSACSECAAGSGEPGMDRESDTGSKSATDDQTCDDWTRLQVQAREQEVSYHGSLAKVPGAGMPMSAGDMPDPMEEAPCFWCVFTSPCVTLEKCSPYDACVQRNCLDCGDCAGDCKCIELCFPSDDICADDWFEYAKCVNRSCGTICGL